MHNRLLPYLLPIRCFLFILIFFIASAITGKDFREISNIWSIVASAVNIATIFLLLFVTQETGGYKKLINFKKGSTKPIQIIKITFLILFLGMGGMYLAGFICYGVIPYAAPMLITPIPLWMAIINLFVLPVTTALAEGGLYLGCGVNQIKNKYVAILLPAFFFALQHSFIPVLLDVKYISYRFLSFLPLTILLCLHYHKHRNPLPIMIGHAIIDVITAVQILATSAIPGLYEMMCGM